LKALFLSDLHLGAGYIEDSRLHEKRVVSFLRTIGNDASHIYMLGDILDYWFEYRNVVPRGFVRFFGELARLSDKGVKILWMTGNHDIWLFDYLRDELNIEIVDAPFVEREIAGKKFIMSHGDRIGAATSGFRFICSLFRNKFCQKLYSGIHPRLTVPFAYRWSSSSRAKGEGVTQTALNKIISDADSLATAYPDTDYIVEGHHHIALDTKLGNSSTKLIVLGDWIDKFTYAEFDGSKLQLKKHEG